MASKTIVLLCGYKRSGKDTAANWLVENKGFKKLSFAEALKDEVARDYRLDRGSLDDQSMKELPLLNYPVMTLDETSKLFNTYFFKETVFRDGTKPQNVRQGPHSLIGIKASGEEDVLYFTRRTIMIMHGALKRAINSNYWVDAVMSKVRPGMKVVISDWRFKNELESAKDWITDNDKFTTVRILRSKNASLDPSENDLNDTSVDVIIDNTGSMESLVKQLENL